MNNDTIFALSSGHGAAGVAVVRISGAHLENNVTQMTGQKNPAPRHAYFTNLKTSAGELIDQCLVIYFPAPHSFTGEDVIEIHAHGAPAVIQKIFEYLTDCGARMATPGEFSRRAFYNNKMDLTDVDGLAALLSARTDKQRRAALRSMTGTDSDIYQTWRAQMIDVAAYAAAIMDYAPDDLPPNIGDTVVARTKKLYDEIATALSRYGAMRAIQDGINITLCGDTNVGKSSLFNRLVGSNRAIVSDIPGTTRDVISATMDIDGYLVRLADTAGVRDTDDTIEKIGIEKTQSEIENADIILRVFDAANAPRDIAPADNELVIINKCDNNAAQTENAICVSAKTGAGLDTLMQNLREKIAQIMSGTESGLIINARTHELLKSAATELESAIKFGTSDYDIFAEHVRAAADAIGQILGTISTSDVLDATFGQLCLGK